MSNFRNVMYYGDFDVHGFYPKDIPADKLTHLNYAFLDFDADGSLRWMNEDLALNSAVGEPNITEGSASAGLLNAFQELRLNHPNLKIGISVGGWTKSGDFAPVAANPVTRHKFVSNLIKFVEYNELDFLDIDWEYPGAVRPGDENDPDDEGTQGTYADYANYVTLLSELRAGLAELGQRTGKQYELSIAVIAGKWVDGEGNSGDPYIKQIFDIIDFGNIMTYDMAGSWVPITMHQTATGIHPEAPDRAQRSVGTNIDYYLENGAPPEKLDVGVAFYTRGWGGVQNDGIDPENLPGLYASNNGAPKDGKDGIWPYRQLPELIAQYGTDANGEPNLKTYWDHNALAPYLYSEKDQVLYTLDDPRSIKAKVDYVKANNLGGIITWMQSQDAEPNAETTVRSALTSEIATNLYGAAEFLPTHKVETQPLRGAWECAETPDGLVFTLTNTEELNETDRVLKSVEAKHKTLKNPLLTITTNSQSDKNFDLNAFGHEEIAPGETVTVPLGTDFVTDDIMRITLQQRIANKPYGELTLFQRPAA